MKMLHGKCCFITGLPWLLTVLMLTFFCMVKLVMFGINIYLQGEWLTQEMARFEDFKRHSLMPLDEVIHERNKHLWNGLDPVEVNKRWPGLILDGDYMLKEFIDPHDRRALGTGRESKTIEDISHADAEERFHQLVTVNHLKCGNKRHLGLYRDGGWDICIAAPYHPSDNCIVYSFGISYDFSFDDEISESFGCQVRSYDPSMSKRDHKRSDLVSFYQIGLGPKNVTNQPGWKIMTFESLLKISGDSDKTIDYLKMDVEIHEWKSLEQILERNTLKNVKQLGVEIHTYEIRNLQTYKSDYLKFYNILLKLETQGFRRYYWHFNPSGLYTSKHSEKKRPCCYELYYVNINFLKIELNKTHPRRPM